MRYSKTHQEATRRKLIEAASLLLLEGGLRGVSIDRVAVAAGLTHGAVYKHFPSKEALLQAALGHAGSVFRRRLSGEGNSTDGLLDWYLSADHRDDVAVGCAVAATAGDAAHADPAIRDAFEGELRALLRLFDDTPATDDSALARTALAVGGLTLARGINDQAFSDRLLAACRQFALGKDQPTGTTFQPAPLPAMPRLSAADTLPRRRMTLPGAELSYIDVGTGPAMIFIHGTNTFSYAWRHVVPHFAKTHRCLAPDLAGMGHSGPAADGSYRYFDQVRHLEAWLDALDLGGGIVLVGHEWGASICFDLAARRPDRVAAIAHLGGLIGQGTVDMFPRHIAALHRQLREPGGEFIILEDNMLFEKVIRRSTLRRLTEAEIDTYGTRWRPPGADRRPLLGLTLDLPLDGDPPDICRHLTAIARVMAASPIPKLHIRGVPGWRRLDPDTAIFRTWRNQHEIDIPGIHLLMEDAPAEVAAAMTDFLEAHGMMPRHSEERYRAAL
jgi:haloalkane dehalogenase